MLLTALAAACVPEGKGDGGERAQDSRTIAAPAQELSAPAMGGLSYVLRNRCGKKLLDVWGGSVDDGAEARQSAEHFGPNQRWRLTDAGDGYFKLTAEHSGKNLEVRGGWSENLTQVQQYFDNGHAAQQWRFLPSSDGWVRVETRLAAGKVLDVDGASTADGARVQLYESNGSCAQDWRLERVSLAGLPSMPPAAERLLFPDAMVDLKARYGLRGDGVTDETEALRRAISENLGRTMYLAAGTYLVSGSLEGRGTDGRWHGGFYLVGQHRDHTIIRLRDGSPGFGDSGAPRAVIFTASDRFITPGTSPIGEGNEAYGNYVQNLTVDTGNNRGAVGIDYLASNTGAVRDVFVRGQGVAGLDLSRAWPGPCLISRVRVEGFDYGVRVGQAQYGVTIEHLQVGGQRAAGLSNRDNILSVRGLVSHNGVPAVENTGGIGLVTLVEGRFTGGAGDRSAVENWGGLFLRDVWSDGYRSALAHGGSAVDGSAVSEWSSSAPRVLFPASPSTSLRLPIQDPPVHHETDRSRWVSVADFGAVADDWLDDTAAIQAAFDAPGKTTVYFPPGRYFVSDTVRVRGDVGRVDGTHAAISPGWGTFGDGAQPRPMFRVEGGSAPHVTIEGFGFLKAHVFSPDHAGLVAFEQASARPLVLRDVSFMPFEHHRSYRSEEGAGPLFVENVTASRWQLDRDQPVWMRQLNPEDPTMRVRNTGARLWVLGIKTESVGTVIHTSGSAQTELLGGTLYPGPTSLVPTGDVAFVNDGARVSLSYATIAYDQDARDYTVYVREGRGGEWRDLLHASGDWRGYGRIIPLHVGR